MNATKTRYEATFPDGNVIIRHSLNKYRFAWRIRSKNVEISGFSGTHDLAEKAAYRECSQRNAQGNIEIVPVKYTTPQPRIITPVVDMPTPAGCVEIRKNLEYYHQAGNVTIWRDPIGDRAQAWYARQGMAGEKLRSVAGRLRTFGTFTQALKQARKAYVQDETR